MIGWVREYRAPTALVVAVLTGAALLGASLAPHLPAVLWNATASAPLGLYRLTPDPAPAVGDWVAYRPPLAIAKWLAASRYLPLNVPLLKRVAAAPGAEICRDGGAISRDGVSVARARSRDRSGRRLPSWRGCRRLRDGEVFLLNPAHDSLDGRYFGVSATADVLGRAEPVWTWTRTGAGGR